MDILLYDDKLTPPDDLSFLFAKNYTRRAGIIPFILDSNNNTYLLLGLSNEDPAIWADLGGRAEKDETTIETAIREFGEESRWVLPINLKNIKKIILNSPTNSNSTNNNSTNNNSTNNNSTNNNLKKGTTCGLNYRSKPKSKNPDQVILIIEVDPNEKNINIDNDFQIKIYRSQYENEMQCLKWIHYHEFLNIPPNKLSLSMQKVQQILKN